MDHDYSSRTHHPDLCAFNKAEAIIRTTKVIMLLSAVLLGAIGIALSFLPEQIAAQLGFIMPVS